ncbi:MAG: flagellar hook-length control protein FliK [Desulfobacterales bacterium]
MKQGAGASEKAAAGEVLQGLASPQSGKADSQARVGSRPSGAGSELHNALNGSGANFTKGAFGDPPSGGRLSANIAAQFTTTSGGPGALSGGAAASLLETAGRAMGSGAVSARPGASISEGLAASSATPLASQPAGALSLTASGKIGGIASLDSAAAAKTSPALRADLIQQVVRNAALVVRNGRPEIRLDLKPESLGSIKLHVTTVNHQVQVKIVAQTQMVKEILEGSLNQLKLDLLNHKLDVERFEVTVAGDPDRGFAEPKPWTGAWAGAQRGRNPSTTGQDNSQDATPDDPKERHQRDPLEAPSPGRVDYFV